MTHTSDVESHVPLKLDRARLNRLEEILAGVETERSQALALRDRLIGLEASTAQYRLRDDALRRDIEHLRSQLVEAQARLATTTEELHEARSQLAEANASKAQLARDLEASQARFSHRLERAVRTRLARLSSRVRGGASGA